MKPSEVTPAAQAGGGTVLRQAAEEEAHQLDDDDAEAERDQELVLGRPAVEMADDHPLHEHADDQHEQRRRR